MKNVFKIILILVFFLTMFIFLKDLNDGCESFKLKSNVLINYVQPRDMDVVSPRTSLIANSDLSPLISSLFRVSYDKKLPSLFVYKNNMLPPLQQQGKCGSCWGSVTCTILASRLALYSKGAVSWQLSLQQLLSCMLERKGCYGGDVEKTFLWLADQNYKLTKSDRFPYRQTRSLLVLTLCPPSYDDGVGVKDKSVVRLTDFVKDNKGKIPSGNDKKVIQANVDNMKKELVTRGPIYSVINIYKDFFTYSGVDVFQSKFGAVEGGHAIAILGYVDPNVDKRPGFDKGYWICVNSWGGKWPTLTKDGYFAMPMGLNYCGIESRSGSALPSFKIDFVPYIDRSLMVHTDYRDFINNLSGTSLFKVK